MRILKEVIKGPVRISIFSWNNKYIVKLEVGGLEQTFKLNELQLDSEDQLELLMSDNFVQEALQRFESMAQSVRNALEGGN